MLVPASFHPYTIHFSEKSTVRRRAQYSQYYATWYRDCIDGMVRCLSLNVRNQHKYCGVRRRCVRSAMCDVNRKSRWMLRVAAHKIANSIKHSLGFNGRSYATNERIRDKVEKRTKQLVLVIENIHSFFYRSATVFIDGDLFLLCAFDFCCVRVCYKYERLKRLTPVMRAFT